MRALVLAALVAVSSAPTVLPVKAETAVVAGGCFWCVESDLEGLPAVREVISGYAGGTTENPTYRNYHDGDHREVVKVDFDESKLSYRDLVGIFLRTIDVTDAGGQFCEGFQGSFLSNWPC